MDKNKRDIVFFDIESTSAEVKEAKIVELAAIKTDWQLNPISELKRVLVNPGVPIPAEASEIHGFTDEVVKDCPLFSKYAKGIFEFFDGCNVGGYNSNRYDIPLLAREFELCNLVWDTSDLLWIDPFQVFIDKEKRDLTAAYKFYFGEDLGGAHGAGADITATLEVLKAQRQRYDDIGSLSWEELHLKYGGADRVDLAGTLKRNEEGVIVYNIGDDKGKSVKDFPGFSQWMRKKKTFPADTYRWLDKVFEK